MSALKYQCDSNESKSWFVRCLRRLDKSFNSKYYLFDEKTSSEDSLDVKISSNSVTLELNSLLKNKNVTKEVKSLKHGG